MSSKKSTKSTNTTEKRLSSLAVKVGIELKRGWRTSLAEWLNLSLSRLSKWIERDHIPKDILIEIERRGYNKTEWMDIDNINKNTPEASKSPPGATNSGKGDPQAGLPLEKQIELYKENERLKIMIEERDRALMFVLNAHKPPEGEKERRESFIILRYFVNNLKGQR